MVAFFNYPKGLIFGEWSNFHANLLILLFPRLPALSCLRIYLHISSAQKWSKLISPEMRQKIYKKRIYLSGWILINIYVGKYNRYKSKKAHWISIHNARLARPLQTLREGWEEDLECFIWQFVSLRPFLPMYLWQMYSKCLRTEHWCDLPWICKRKENGGAICV